SAVVSVILGDPHVAADAAARCRERGVHVGCFRPPSVPAGTSRLRLTARANLTDDERTLVDEVLTDILAGARA
ncbi:8-amino-7-oxononanoate synthase, partial [Rhodococcus rhodochrous]|nr:8-amino-7-oxononanoate synthase [Rhodococcus rhodochrous]